MVGTKSFLAGIDTGGTYTDAVLIDAASGAVAATAKALTTKGNLSVGVIEALERVIAAAGDDAARQVRLVSISTTLATNAVVEGHGSPVAILLVGFDPEMVARSKLVETFPNCRSRSSTAATTTTAKSSGRSTCTPSNRWCAGTATRWPRSPSRPALPCATRAHEQRVREIIEREAPGKPVTLSTELSSDLDAPRRALTAVLNARLLSRIADLIASVSLARERLGIDAPLMITRGDGSLARAEAVALRPIETILSGPPRA